MTTDDLLTEQEYARHARISQRTARREREAGQGPPFLKIGTRVRYRRSDIDAFLQARTRPSATAAAAADLEQYVRRLVDEAPPLTPALRDRLAFLLRNGSDEESDDSRSAASEDGAA
ncbi:MAG TPA: helix-turn-helix domain-containing protein [Actinomycetospora sp.]|jgi:predicted DNA-binding transcriptional regulator AlpA|uniref:helix-turn-helix transcriptional regulator n=1 Tax=Actinomycetospora sp. TaxID=1872135 RepID=UPI002F416C47